MEEGKMSFRTKLLLGGIGGSFALVIIFIVVIIATLMIIGIIDVEGLGSSSKSGLAYSDISSSSGYWWPIGSADTEVDGGITYAKGDPVESTISSYFGPREDPMGSGATYDHGALDISAPGYDFNQVNIIAAKDGKVIYPSVDSVINCGTSTKDSGDHDCGEGYGNYVMIEHDDGTITLYGHMYANSITVKAGDTVKQGQVIGKMGSSGNSTGMHLHFEVRVNNERVDPLNYVDINNPRPVRSSSGSGLLDFKDFKFVAGTSDKQSICLTLKANGLSDVATAGIMGNIEQESSYSPTAINAGGCIGIVQWCDRSAKVKQVYGDNWKILENQLEFVFYELANNESANKSYLSLDISSEDMAYRFCEGYERPGHVDCMSGNRQNFAKNVLSYVQNGCK